MAREDKILKLKGKIKEYIDNGGKISDSRKDVPYYRYLCNLVIEDYKNGINSTISSIYKECGYDYVDKRQPVTLERIKKEIDDFVDNGGDIYSKREDLPYYEAIYSFIRRRRNEGWNLKKIYEACGYEYAGKKEEITLHRLKKEIAKFIANGGDINVRNPRPPYYYLLCDIIKKFKKEEGINYSIEDIMKMCGYDWKSVRFNLCNINEILNDYKDRNGYIDNIKKSELGKKVLACIKAKAINKQMELNDYLMVIFGARLYETFVDVDYFSLVEKELKEFENQYGKENVTLANIERCNKRLLYRIDNLARYFPYGSVNSSSVLDALGYDVEVNEKHKLDERKILAELEKIYPNKQVYKLSEYPSVRYGVNELSAYYDQTVEQYLKTRGFNIVNRGETYRLSKALVKSDDNLFEYICAVRNKLIKESKIMNNSNSTQKDISEELEKMSYKVIDSLKNIKNASKR